MSEMIVGIDLGTTNSAVAVPREGRVEIVPIDGAETMPSCVGLNAQGELVVGRAARNQYVFLPEQTIVSVKRRMGEAASLTLGGKSYRPQEISALILRELKRQAEAFLGMPVGKAVITVPAYFNDAQRQATREAGVMAGLEVVRILNEPTAACLAYETHRHSEARTVLAFDLGGGTFDVSVVHMDGDMVEVLASHGDNHLGGDDFDQILCEELVERLELPEGAMPGAIALNRLRRAAEEAKIRLSDDDSTRIIEEALKLTDGSTVNLDTELERARFEELIAPLLRKALLSVRQALTLSDKRARDIHDVVLVGGSTRSPIIGTMLKAEWDFDIRCDLHPDLAVAYGAGIMAGRLMGIGNQRILVDVTPYTFGTSALGLVNGGYGPHLYCPIIQAGTPLPVVKSQTFYTVHRGQEEVEVNVFEGENEDARQNILIGQFLVKGLTKDAPESSPVVMRMSLDLDGILTVTAIEKKTGLSKDVRIERAMDKLSGEALDAARAKLDMLFKDSVALERDGLEDAADEALDAPNFDDDDETAAHVEARVVARRLREKMPTLDAVDREDAESLLARLDEAVDEDAIERIASIASDIEDLLFYVESGT